MKIVNINAQYSSSTHLHGGKNVSYVHLDFKSKQVKSFLRDLISTYQYIDFNDLSDSDKAQLVALLNEAGGTMDEFCCITEPSHSDMTINSFRKILSGNKKEVERFIELLTSNAIAYYEAMMIDLFNEVLEEYETDKTFERYNEAYA